MLIAPTIFKSSDTQGIWTLKTNLQDTLNWVRRARVHVRTFREQFSTTEISQVVSQHKSKARCSWSPPVHFLSLGPGI